MKFWKKKKVEQHSLGQYTESDLNAMSIALGAVYRRTINEGGIVDDTDVLICAAASQVYHAMVKDDARGVRYPRHSLWVAGVQMGYRLAGYGLSSMIDNGTLVPTPKGVPHV